MDTDFKDSRCRRDFHVDDVSSEAQMDVVAHEVRRHFALLDGAPAHMYVEQRRGDESWTYVRLPETGTTADADLFNAKGRIIVSHLNGEQLRVRRAELSAFVNSHVGSVLPGQSTPEWARSLQPSACRLEELQRAQWAVQLHMDGCIGRRVRIQGLQSTVGAELNGNEGRLLQWQLQKQRWEVALLRTVPGCTAAVNVKAECLQMLPEGGEPSTEGGAPDSEMLDAAISTVASSDVPLQDALNRVRHGAANTRPNAPEHNTTLNNLLGEDHSSCAHILRTASCIPARSHTRC